MHVCIIGVGPLGRRHAEGVVMSGICTKLTILDLSYDAIGKTKQFLNDLPESDISTDPWRPLLSWTRLPSPHHR